MASAFHPSAACSPALLGRRVCAGLAACSALLHGVMVGHAGNPITVAVILAMMATCLYCARDLWIGSSLRAWGLVALMNLGMIVVHCSMPVHQHGATLTTSGLVAEPSSLMMAAIAISAGEVAVATAVLYHHARDRARSVIAN
jgi:hypothetical protein